MKKFLLIFLFSFACFFGIDRLYAYNSNVASGWYVNQLSASTAGVGLNYDSFVSFTSSSNRQWNFNAYIYESQGDTSGTTIPSYLYQRVGICTNGSLSNASSVSNSSEDVVYSTSIKCNILGKGSSGYIYFIQNKVGSQVVGEVGKYSLYNQLNIYTSTGDYALLSQEYSFQPFPAYSPEDTIIKQNDSILNYLSQLTSNNSQIIYQQQQTNTKLEETNQAINDTKDTITNDDTSESTNKANEFFQGFNTDTHGLTGIITAPIALIGNITSSSCTALQVPLPFVNEKISLPCMSSIYSKYFGSFYDIYKIITFGIVSYWVCVRIFNLVKDFKNPEHDEIEVMDL